jgi:hypothetical protein
MHVIINAYLAPPQHTRAEVALNSHFLFLFKSDRARSTHLTSDSQSALARVNCQWSNGPVSLSASVQPVEHGFDSRGCQVFLVMYMY